MKPRGCDEFLVSQIWLESDKMVSAIRGATTIWRCYWNHITCMSVWFTVHVCVVCVLCVLCPWVLDSMCVCVICVFCVRVTIYSVCMCVICAWMCFPLFVCVCILTSALPLEPQLNPWGQLFFTTATHLVFLWLNGFSTWGWQQLWMETQLIHYCGQLQKLLSVGIGKSCQICLWWTDQQTSSPSHRCQTCCLSWNYWEQHNSKIWTIHCKLSHWWSTGSLWVGNGNGMCFPMSSTNSNKVASFIFFSFQKKVRTLWETLENRNKFSILKTSNLKRISCCLFIFCEINIFHLFTLHQQLFIALDLVECGPTALSLESVT